MEDRSLPEKKPKRPRILPEMFGFGAVIVTLGKDGMALASRDGTTARMATIAKDVFDVSGAGDTAVATAAAAMAAGASVHQAAELANMAAGIVVGKVGTAVVHASELIQALHRQDLARAESKLLALEPARDRIDVWRRQGMKIGLRTVASIFCIQGMYRCWRRPNRLVIVWWSASTTMARWGASKGPSRPFQSEAARATVLASLASVDVVVMFSDDTPLELIKVLRPDVLIKAPTIGSIKSSGPMLSRSMEGKSSLPMWNRDTVHLRPLSVSRSNLRAIVSVGGVPAAHMVYTLGADGPQLLGKRQYILPTPFERTEQRGKNSSETNPGPNRTGFGTNPHRSLRGFADCQFATEERL